jgi:acyl-CoA thioesterase FadM
MPLQKIISLHTHIYDLDWNRHVTSRTYERFSYDGRFSLLEDLGFGVHSCLEKGISFVSGSTFVRFLSQQFPGALLDIITTLNRDKEGNLYFHHMIQDQSAKKVCELYATANLINLDGSKIVIESVPLLDVDWKESQLHARKQDQTTAMHSLAIPFSDMSCFWNLPSESVWKIFEEGRFLFFKEIVDLKLIKETDSTTFFMGGEIQIYKLPEPGSNIQLLSWIDSFEKIRFYFRQDIVSETGETLASMRDEQLFVALSTSRPRKAPQEFFSRVERFIET